jgi:hypothetical protein
MNSERIGQAAGVIWKKLRDRGETGLTLTEIKKITGFTTEEALAGIGWLAREGKLCFPIDGKKSAVKLVHEEIFA